MKRYLIIIVLITLGGLFSCAQLSPEVQKKLDSLQTADKQGQYMNPSKQQPWQVGQWSLYKTSSITRDGFFYLFDSSLNKGFIQILVATAEGDDYWLELRIVANDKEQHIAALIAEEQLNGDLYYKIKQLKHVNNNHVRQFTEIELLDGSSDEVQSDVNIWLNFILHSMQGGILRNVDLAAGEFLHIREVPISISLWLGQMSGYAWYHNAVPIFPVAKFELTTSTTQWSTTIDTVELVDFGNIGQKSYFSYE